MILYAELQEFQIYLDEFRIWNLINNLESCVLTPIGFGTVNEASCLLAKDAIMLSTLIIIISKDTTIH